MLNRVVLLLFSKSIFNNLVTSMFLIKECIQYFYLCEGVCHNDINISRDKNIRFSFTRQFKCVICITHLSNPSTYLSRSGTSPDPINSWPYVFHFRFRTQCHLAVRQCMSSCAFLFLISLVLGSTGQTL